MIYNPRRRHLTDQHFEGSLLLYMNDTDKIVKKLRKIRIKREINEEKTNSQDKPPSME